MFKVIIKLECTINEVGLNGISPSHVYGNKSLTVKNVDTTEEGKKIVRKIINDAGLTLFEEDFNACKSN